MNRKMGESVDRFTFAMLVGRKTCGKSETLQDNNCLIKKLPDQ